MDTKYLATHAEGDLNASPTLQEIAEGLANQPLPNIVTHPDHSKYQDTESFHEAGYDSLLTATIMIRLAAKLGANREKEDPSKLASLKPTNAEVDDFVRDGREKVAKPVPLPPKLNPEDESAQLTGKQRRRQKRKSKNSKETQERRFQSKNIFDNLRELQLNPENESAENTTEDTETPDQPESEPTIDLDDAEATRHDTPACANVSWENTPTWDEPPAACEPGSWINELFVQDETGWVPIEQSKWRDMELMPKFDDNGFWEEFGNTLRVFGTQEGLCKIAEW